MVTTILCHRHASAGVTRYEELVPHRYFRAIPNSDRHLSKARKHGVRRGARFKAEVWLGLDVQPTFDAQRVKGVIDDVGPQTSEGDKGIESLAG